MATFAIGDIQGCFETFQRLLVRCAFDLRYDTLWLVGDLVNRGPRSLETLRYVRDLGPAAVTVLGNHDLALLIMSHGQGRRFPDDTFDDILDAPDREQLIAWLRQQRLCYRERGFCMVHAGLLPQWTVDQALSLAAEVEAALRGPEYPAFMAHMWGSEPAAWRDDLVGWDRLRVIVNAMTRMRFCTPEGVMDFSVKGEVTEGPPGYLPWFEAPSRLSADTTLITGHWSALNLRIEDNLLAIDSGCLWGGALTAVRLEDRAVFQEPCAPGESRG